MHWDIFCKIIDNHGDLGVCWRLACQLAALGERVRLWVDDPTALHWMAPAGCEGVEVVDWLDGAAARRAVAAPPPDVLVEAFGCEPAPELIARFAEPQAGGAHRPWINLEYLSAEAYVERLHGLPSPVFKGPGTGLTKRFFYPGFTPATGGLLREPDLRERQSRFDRAAWLAAQEIPWQEGERLVSLFCYEPPALAALLDQLGTAAEPTRLLVTAGRATHAVKDLLAHRGFPTAGPAGFGDALALTFLPYLTQPDFDHLLWACDFNLVRGEDSLVRGLWAGAPLAWQIYPQDDDAHHVKLNAWLDWLDAPASLRRFHYAWNGFGTVPLPPLETLGAWRETMLSARQRLWAQDDLATQLRHLIAGKS